MRQVKATKSKQVKKNLKIGMEQDKRKMMIPYIWVYVFIPKTTYLLQYMAS